MRSPYAELSNRHSPRGFKATLRGGEWSRRQAKSQRKVSAWGGIRNPVAAQRAMICAIGLCAAGAHAAIPAAERQALLDLYTSTNGATWTNSTGVHGATWDARRHVITAGRRCLAAKPAARSNGRCAAGRATWTRAARWQAVFELHGPRLATPGEDTATPGRHSWRAQGIPTGERTSIASPTCTAVPMPESTEPSAERHSITFSAPQL
jgi:hypothetical protein